MGKGSLIAHKIKKAKEKDDELTRLQKKDILLIAHIKALSDRIKASEQRSEYLGQCVTEARQKLTCRSSVSRKVFSGLDAGKIQRGIIIKRIHMLENQSNKTLIHLCNMKLTNNRYREGINLKRHTCLKKTSYEKQMRTQFKGRQKGMAKLMAAANEAYEQLAKIKEKVSALNQKDEKTRNDFKQEMQQLKLDILKQRKHKEQFMAMNNKNGSDSGNGKFLREQEAEMRNKMNQLNQRKAPNKSQNRLQNMTKLTYESAFKILMKELNSKEVRGIVEQFIRREDHNFSVYSIIQNLHLEKKQAEQRLIHAHQAIEKYKADEATENASRLQILTEINQRKERITTATAKQVSTKKEHMDLLRQYSKVVQEVLCEIIESPTQFVSSILQPLARTRALVRRQVAAQEAQVAAQAAAEYEKRRKKKQAAKQAAKQEAQLSAGDGGVESKKPEASGSEGNSKSPRSGGPKSGAASRAGSPRTSVVGGGGNNKKEKKGKGDKGSGGHGGNGKGGGSGGKDKHHAQDIAEGAEALVSLGHEVLKLMFLVPEDAGGLPDLKRPGTADSISSRRSLHRVNTNSANNVQQGEEGSTETPIVSPDNLSPVLVLLFECIEELLMAVVRKSRAMGIHMPKDAGRMPPPSCPHRIMHANAYAIDKPTMPKGRSGSGTGFDDDDDRDRDDVPSDRPVSSRELWLQMQQKTAKESGGPQTLRNGSVDRGERSRRPGLRDHGHHEGGASGHNKNDGHHEKSAKSPMLQMRKGGQHGGHNPHGGAAHHKKEAHHNKKQAWGDTNGGTRGSGGRASGNSNGADGGPEQSTGRVPQTKGRKHAKRGTSMRQKIATKRSRGNSGKL